MNIILAGVGGQGLVLATRIISNAALQAGFDVKTNDVIGLSQRGGKVWGSIKIGDRVYSPNILKGRGDILIGMEPVEALRWKHYIKKGGLCIFNSRRIPPSSVLMERDTYPDDVEEQLEESMLLVKIDAREEALRLGNIKGANMFLIGRLAKELDIEKETWYQVIRENVPPKSYDFNRLAFDRGFEM